MLALLFPTEKSIDEAAEDFQDEQELLMLADRKSHTVERAANMPARVSNREINNKVLYHSQENAQCTKRQDSCRTLRRAREI